MSNKGLFTFSIYDMTEIAIFVAISIALDTFVKIPIGSTGGSINISALPLMILALRHGPFKGFVASGIVFGFITCLIDGYGLITYPLEYLISFGAIGLLGFLGARVYNIKKNTTATNILTIVLLFLLVLAWALIRLVASSIDSHFLWELDWAGAFAYNVLYVFPTAAFDYVVMSIFIFTLIPMTYRFNTTFILELKQNTRS